MAMRAQILPGRGQVIAYVVYYFLGIKYNRIQLVSKNPCR